MPVTTANKNNIDITIKGKTILETDKNNNKGSCNTGQSKTYAFLIGSSMFKYIHNTLPTKRSFDWTLFWVYNFTNDLCQKDTPESHSSLHNKTVEFLKHNQNNFVVSKIVPKGDKFFD